MDLGEQSGAFTPMAKGQLGAPVVHIQGTFLMHARVSASKGAQPGARQAPARSASPSPRRGPDIADYPTNTMDDAVAYGVKKAILPAGRRMASVP